MVDYALTTTGGNGIGSSHSPNADAGYGIFRGLSTARKCMAGNHLKPPVRVLSAPYQGLTNMHTKTLKLRIKDKHASVLSTMARDVKRDVNAAKNILRRGLATLEVGALA